MFRDFTIGFVLKAMVSLIIATFLAVILSNFMILKNKSKDSLILNQAGRQGMLSQKYFKEVILELEHHKRLAIQASLAEAQAETTDAVDDESGDLALDSLNLSDEPSTETLTEVLPPLHDRNITQRLFEATQNALASGGEAYLDLAAQETVTLMAITNPDVLAQWKKIQKQWLAMKNQTEQVLSSSQAGNLPDEATVKQLNTMNVDLLQELNLAATMLQDLSDAKLNMLNTVQLTGFLLVICLGVLCYLTVKRKVVVPLTEVVEMAEAVAAGDLSREITADGADEVARLNKVLNEMTNHLNGMILGIRDKAGHLTRSSNDLIASTSAARQEAARTSEQSASITQSSRNLNENAGKVATEAEQVNKDTQQIAQVTENIADGLSKADHAVSQLSANANHLASTVETVASILEDVATGTGRTRSMSEDASKRAEGVAEKVDLLGRSAEQVGEVIHLIKSVADQTNLLALNATIEAASAGDAGKGFGVVANEVKELARKTANATREIQEQVEVMLNNTRGAVGAIKETVILMQELSTDFEGIANSVDEQNHTISNLSAQLGENAENTVDAHHNVHQAVESVDVLRTHLKGLLASAQKISTMVNDNRNAASSISDSQADIEMNIKSNAAALEQSNSTGVQVGELTQVLQEELARFRLKDTATS